MAGTHPDNVGGVTAFDVMYATDFFEMRYGGASGG